MSQYKYAEIADTVYFWFAANGTDGAAGDGATPLYDVRLAGAASGAAPMASGTPTLLTHANYTDGLYEIAIDTTGWAAGEYAVFCTLTISTVNPAGFCGSFKLRTAGTAALKTDVVAIGGVAQSATDLKDLVDTGYDPETHKVQGVVLTDTCTDITTKTGFSLANASIVTDTFGTCDFTSTMKTSITTAASAATPAVTVSDKTGFKLASDGLAAVTTWTCTITGNIVGTVSTVTTLTNAPPDSAGVTILVSMTEVVP